jgi:hypothetical protein
MDMPEFLPTNYNDGYGVMYLRAFTGTDVIFSRKGCVKGVCSLKDWLARCQNYRTKPTESPTDEQA